MILIKRLWGPGLALCGLCAAAAHANPAEPVAPSPLPTVSAEFPRPEVLKPNIEFWTQVFSQYSAWQSIIHSQDAPQKIYAVLDFRDERAELGEAAARRLQVKTEKAVEKEINGYLRHVQQLSKTPEQLSPIERRLYDMFADGTDPNRWAGQIGRFRAQRGLKEATERALNTSGQYLPKMEEIFKAQGLPPMLTRLPLVESSFNVEAYSKVGAAGLWQFIPSSARLYMRLDEAVDDRRDPWTSTEAAAQHLKEDYALLGNWPLAITAYNFGRDGLARGLRQVKGTELSDLIERWDGKRFGFASRNFYSEFIAASDVERDYRTHFGEIERKDPIEFEATQISHFVAYDSLRKCAGVDEETFRALNPGFRPEVLDGRLYVPPQTTIRVPVGKGAAFKAAYDALPDGERYDQQRFYYVRYRVQNGDNLGAIARRYGIPVASLKEANGFGKKTFIRAGQFLRIPPRGAHATRVAASVKPEPAGAAKTAAAVANGITYLLHKVRPGQNLTTIAEQYRTTIAQLRQLNDLSETQVVRAGSTLKVPTY